MSKLAYLSNYFPYMTETFIYREVQELQRRGVAPAIYSLRRPGDREISHEALPLREATFYLLPVPCVSLLSSHAWFWVRAPLVYCQALVKMLTGKHFKVRDLLRSITHFGEGAVLARRMTRDGITHIHAHYASQSASVARTVHLLTGIPYSFTGHAHDIWHDRLQLPEKLSEAVFAVTCSEYARQRLAREGGCGTGKIHVVYHGLDVRKFSPPEDRSVTVPNLILSVGSLGETKGFPDLITACAMVRERGVELQCLIVGEGPQRRELEALIRKLDLEEVVVLVGAVKQEELLQYYHRAWVFALPCIVLDDGRQDGLPNVLMESMAAGVPVITTTTTAKAELIEDGREGILISPHAPGQLADALVKILQDPELRERLSREGRRKVEEVFDNHRTIEPLLALFERFAQ